MINKKIFFIGIFFVSLILLIAGLIIAQFSGGSFGGLGAGQYFGGGAQTPYSGSGQYSGFGSQPSQYPTSGLNAAGVRVYGGAYNPQFNNPGFFSSSGFTSPEVYWPDFNKNSCLARQDFIIQIAPGGCSPAVVRSDLLEEQNVPVFCQLMALKTNPLIDVSRIRSLRFTGEYPKGVSGVSYFPARAAVASQRSLISSPVENNLGYLVVVLDRNEIEGNMPDFLEGNLTASIQYDAQGALGIGNTNFYLEPLNDLEWQNDYKNYGFWNGKGYIRADSIDPESATLSIYQNVDAPLSTITLRRGETSQDIYLNGFYCAAGMNIRLDNIGVPVDKALLQINDQQFWVARGDRILENRCSVIDLRADNGGGRVSLNCPVQNGRFDLLLTPGVVSMNIDNVTREYLISDRITADNKLYYVGYIGKDVNGEDFVVLVQDPLSLNSFDFSENQVYNVIQDVIERNKIGQRKNAIDLKEEIRARIVQYYGGRFSWRGLINNNQNTNNSGINVEILTKSSSFNNKIIVNQINSVDNAGFNNLGTEGTLIREYYESAISYYEELHRLYPDEKISGSDEDPYAATGLYNAAQLSYRLGMNEKAYELQEMLINEYPNSAIAQRALRENSLLSKYDTSLSKSVVYLDNYPYFIQVLDFKKPLKEDLSVVLFINEREEIIGLNEIRTIDQGNGQSIYIQLVSVDRNRVGLRLSKYIPGGNVTQYNPNSAYSYGAQSQYNYGYSSQYSTQFLDLYNSVEYEGNIIRLARINLKEQAKISITPKAFGPISTSSFKFKIGIEKRGIKLSPNKTKEVIENLDKSIKEWEDVNEKLGKVVTGFKTACFATSGVLTIKNLFSGFSGEALARSRIMTNPSGWNRACEDLVSDEKYESIEQCLLDHSSEINSDIKIYQENLGKTNKILENIQDQEGIERSDILDLEGQVDRRKVEDSFKNEFNKFAQTNAEGEIILPDKDKTVVSIKDTINWSTLTHEQRRDIMTLYNAREQAKAQGSSVLQGVIDNELGSTTLNAKNFWEFEGARVESLKRSEKYGLGFQPLTPFGDKITYADIKTVTDGDKIKDNGLKFFDKGKKVVWLYIPFSESFVSDPFTARGGVGGREVVIPLQVLNADNYIVDPSAEIYYADGSGKLSPDALSSVREYIGLANIRTIKESTIKAYQNRMLKPEELRVKYFDRAPYKGLPAEIPFDPINGWYVELTYVLSGFGQPYDQSGRAINFYICNVGPNGIIEYKRGNDDICRYYNAETGADLGFPGMDPSESVRLITSAQQAISEAARQYRDGIQKVVIGGNTFKTGISAGGEDGRCSDFMSPSDCNLMFNACDPVICPASRCDLGGNYRVDDVLQTGVVGGLALCLPNAKEGIAVPICLSGVHAGVEGYVSILKSARACLNESLETGRHIGICDEIKSIYLCEFFWREASPFLNVIIPRKFEGFHSQGVRGGGEYLTVMSAWDNTQKSIDFFKNQYAVNSFRAFNARSTDEIGGEVCKSFVSTTYPTSKGLFDKLVEPDSPVQFHAWYDENVLTSATVPPTSHYKVYYHVYAGKDQGAYYSIYLRDIVQSNYIRSNPFYVVDQGYIARGEQLDRSRDFTAVSGYKQLCVNVNGQEECGFGKVSTSYLLNSLTDDYAAEQIKTDIKSEKECVAGSSSVRSLLQPNLQSGVEELINPAIYNKGIIRVCATQNPGRSVNTNGEYDTTNTIYDKWKEVGYCDDPTIKCWLDTDSVKLVIKDKGIENQTLAEVDTHILNNIDFLSPEESATLIVQSEEAINNLQISSQDDQFTIEQKIFVIRENLIRLSNLGADNRYRARAFYSLAVLYTKITDSLQGYKKVGLVNGTSVQGTAVDRSQFDEFGNPINSGNINNPADVGVIPQENTSQQNVEWSDSMLKIDVLITVNSGLFTKQSIAYRYDGKKWISENTNFVNLNLGYVEGIRYLVGRTNDVRGDSITVDGKLIQNILSDTNEEMSGKIFGILKK